MTHNLYHLIHSVELLMLAVPAYILALAYNCHFFCQFVTSTFFPTASFRSYIFLVDSSNVENE